MLLRRGVFVAAGLALGAFAGACQQDAGGSCEVGSYGCACSGQLCQTGLECVAGVCLFAGGETGDENPTGDGDPTGDTGDPSCDPGLTWCGVKCVNLDEHPQHCGACNEPCAEGEVCQAGTCEFISNCTETPCPGFSYCDLQDELCKPGCGLDSQCGTNQACDPATHDCTCATNYKLCEGSCVPDSTICAGECGDGIKDPGEECDGPDLDGQTCASHGIQGGDLSCSWNCTFDTSDCSETACGQDYFFEFEAVDADFIHGFVPEFVPGEGTVLSHDGTGQAFIRFYYDIPCDDQWHMWIRAVDDGPEDTWEISINNVTGYQHDMDCTDQPAQPQYKWRHLNYRKEGDPHCTYTLDPFVLYWTTGEQLVNYSIVDSDSMSRIFLTNTEQPPP